MKFPKKVLPVLVGLASTSAGFSYGQETTGASSVEELVVVGVRETRVSKGATGLPLELKETPQTISIIDQGAMEDFAVTGSNEALALSTGINVEQYETNRAAFNSRGFEIQLTQVDGLGMTNSYGTVEGQLDTFLFEKIELIRGANGLLTGVGNASGTINYVRKRPTNQDEGKLVLSGGSYDYMRAALDYNKLLTSNGSWAGRVVMAYEDSDSYLRDLHNEKISLYGVVDGQIGDNGVLTIGVTHLEDNQDSPMWGSLTLVRADGSQADVDVSTSTSQKWTYWNTESTNAFIEYTHQLAGDWEAKATYNIRRGDSDSRLLYAYSATTGTLNNDNTGLVGWPYSAHNDTDNDLFDINLTGTFDALGNQHSLIVGASSSTQETASAVFNYDTDLYQFLPLPAFPFDGNSYPEPEWSELTPERDGEQKLTRLYAASQISITDKLKTIVGVNAIKLEREGSSRYGNAVSQTYYPDTEETSPYVGVTYDITRNVTGYVSYSDIFQNQDQTDINGMYLDPMKGVNLEAGVKAEWLDQRLLTTLAVFQAEQQGIATYLGLTDSGAYYYGGEDVESEGVELEAVGQITDNTNIAFGITHLDISGPNGESVYQWIPETTVNLRLDTRLLDKLRVGINSRWQSETIGSAAKQDSFFRADVFAAYDISDAATVKFNINNVTDEKYVQGLAYGAIYGAPLHGRVSFDYKF